MILSVFLGLLAVGFVTWMLGVVFGWPGIATIGGAIVVGVGAMVIAGGLEYQSGQVRDHDNTTNTTVITQTYSPVSMPEQYSLGFLVTLLGGVAILRSLDYAGG